MGEIGATKHSQQTGKPGPCIFRKTALTPHLHASALATVLPRLRAASSPQEAKMRLRPDVDTRYAAVILEKIASPSDSGKCEACIWGKKGLAIFSHIKEDVNP